MLTTTRTLAPAGAEAVLALAGAVAASDGTEPLNDAARFALRGQRDADHLLLAGTAATPDAPGDLLGYAQLDDEARTVVMFVHPQHRRQGLGTQLLDQVRTLEPTPGVWAFGNLPPAQAFAAARGLHVERELLVMRRDLARRPVEVADADAAPDGVRIDTFAQHRADADLDELVAVNAAAFAHHPEQGALTADDFRARTAEPWFDPEGLLLAYDGATGRLLGYHWTKVEESAELGRHGEVYAIGVHPDAGGRGIGRALLTAGLDHLQRQGVPAVILYVEADAGRTVEMYRVAGFDDLYRDASYR